MSESSFLVPAEQHSRWSTYRESVIEHRLLADLLGRAWARGVLLEVSRSEFDAFGYDLVLSVGPVVRHVQVKASVVGGRTSKQTINQALAAKPAGCVVWVVAVDTAAGLEPDHYLYFGGGPTDSLPPLGDILGRNPRSKTERPDTRVVTKARFVKVPDVAALFEALFGDSATTT